MQHQQPYSQGVRKFEGLDKVDFTTSYDQRDDQFGMGKGLIEQLAEDVDTQDKSTRPAQTGQDARVGKNIFATKKVLSPIDEIRGTQQTYL